MLGQTLAHYEILRKLGQGGMGEVYLARDTKLDRQVALKVLSPEFAQSDDRRRRFEREAKALAALDHANIVQVFSVEEADGTQFITMQLVQGKTLADLLPKGGFPLSEFFKVAIPLADAVAAAHEQGIVHRDLKPANVMLTEDGRLKVLDFGLSQSSAPTQLESDSQSPTVLKTKEGVLAGTLQYMSPEQAEGKTVDTRSDIFSMGVIFYEWLAGARPFLGDTPASLLSAVIKDTPPSIADLKPGLPRDLSRIVRRCLHKDVSRRFQTALDVRNELSDLEESFATGKLEAGAIPSAAATKSRWPGYVAAGIVGAALAGTVVMFPRLGEESSVGDGPRVVNPVQVTAALGLEDYPSWSPDGQTLAYGVKAAADASGVESDWDIWVTQIGSGHGLNRTAEFDDDFRYPVWSPDGRQLAVWSSRDGGGYFVMPALAGPLRKMVSIDSLADIDPHQPQWSPDGSKILGVVGRAGVAALVSLDTGNTERVTLPGEGFSRFDLSWSPDGRYLAYVDADVHSGQGQTTIWIWRWEDGKGWATTSGPGNNWSPTWSADSRSLFYVSNRGGSWDLWEQALGNSGQVAGEAKPVTTGIGVHHAALSRDGSKLAYARGRRISNVWRVPISKSRPATWAEAVQLTFDQAFIEMLDVSKDGTLVLSTDRSGNPDLWVRDASSGEMRQLTTDPTPDWAPKWSPDGQQVAFYAFRGGKRELWSMPAGGGKARKVIDLEAGQIYPDWSPDGRSIAFAASAPNTSIDIWIAPAEGGEARRLMTDPASDNFPTWSPDGRSLVFWSLRTKEPRLWKLELETGRIEPLGSGPGRYSRWSPDGAGVFFIGDRERRSNIWFVSAEDGKVTRMTQFQGRPGGLVGAALATDGTYLYFAWEESVSDIWVMDVVRD
jgi:eukaryotic-like serine/threonine-protein kinase